MITCVGRSGRQNGMSLIEVLVAAIIIAVGLMGLAGLQVRSLQMNNSAQYRSQANFHAYDIVDAMRMNRDSAREGEYDLAMGDDAPDGANIAAKALRDWRNTIKSTLPMKTGSGNTGGSVEVVGKGGRHEVRVEVAWLDERWRKKEDADGKTGDKNQKNNKRIQRVVVETDL